MIVSLQEGLYELCRLRIAGDEEFKAASGREDFSLVDDALFDQYRLFQLRRTLALVSSKSAFYRKLFAANNVRPDEIQSLADLARLPFTTAADLSGNSYNFLCTSRGDVEKPVTFHSSGSTGVKKRVFFSAADVQKILDFLPRGMNTVIDRDEARVQVFLQNTLGRGIGQILAAGLEQFGMRAWTSELTDSAGQIIGTTIHEHVNVWFGEAITIYRVTKLLARRMDLSKLGMKCIFITMTNIPDSMISYLQRTWNCRVSTHYGLTEMGWGLAVDCDVCDGYHYNELDVIAEIVDPETGAPLPYGEAGEVVLTSISRDCMPLIRYRTGDIATLAPCQCGGHLEVMGHIRRRREGMYDLGGGRLLYPALLEEELFSVDELLDYRMFASGNQIYIDVEATHASPSVSENIANRLAALPALQGVPRPIITLLPEGALREFCFEKKRVIPGRKL